jgi:hypothetical protein
LSLDVVVALPVVRRARHNAIDGLRLQLRQDVARVIAINSPSWGVAR